MSRFILFVFSFLMLLSSSSCSENENTVDQVQDDSDSEAEFETGNSSETEAETEIVKVPSDFVPDEFAIFEKIFGDLNKDGQEDCVLITKGTDPTRVVNDEYLGELDRNRRGIIVLFKDRNSYELASQNDDCFSSENEDGGVYFPPDLSVEIKNGKLYFHYGHGRYGYWSYTFRYQDDDFKLIGFDQASHNGPALNYSTSYNFLTGKKLKKENINFDSEHPDDEKIVETWSELEKQELISLSKVEDFDELWFN
jgi:hypothetical protein